MQPSGPPWLHGTLRSTCQKVFQRNHPYGLTIICLGSRAGVIFPCHASLLCAALHLCSDHELQHLSSLSTFHVLIYPFLWECANSCFVFQIMFIGVVLLQRHQTILNNVLNHGCHLVSSFSISGIIAGEMSFACFVAPRIS